MHDPVDLALAKFVHELKLLTEGLNNMSPKWWREAAVLALKEGIVLISLVHGHQDRRWQAGAEQP